MSDFSQTDLEQSLRAGQALLWCNPQLADEVAANTASGISLADIEAAQARFRRCAPLLARLFPELTASGGQIESPLFATPALQQALQLPANCGQLWLKADHGLPVAGSIKARGGIHEVLEFAERLALEHALIDPSTDYAQLAEAPARALFGRYRVLVGSTGNLGLSIGVMAAALGFRAEVHMSADAKAWKKKRLRERGVTVVEHLGDYEEAVAAGRRQAEQDPYCYFVDDERSPSLLLGYSAAALHLREQLSEAGLRVDAEHPLFVYLPCGVGGAPAGVAFGLKQLFGAHVHCFFAEPTQSPCFLIGLMAEPGQPPSVYQHGLDNRTEADGLAVPRASALALELMRPLLSGVFSMTDEQLMRQLYLAGSSQGLRIEPSAAAGFSGPELLCQSPSGRAYLTRHGLQGHMPQATHLLWTTGGLFVPEEEYQRFYARGAAAQA
jgi:D-serine dehydratase